MGKRGKAIRLGENRRAPADRKAAHLSAGTEAVPICSGGGRQLHFDGFKAIQNDLGPDAGCREALGTW